MWTINFFRKINFCSENYKPTFIEQINYEKNNKGIFKEV